MGGFLVSLDRLGPYVLDELIGHGASCRVWRAKPADGSAPVAIKILRSERADEPDSRARFLAEGQLLVDHPIPGAVKVLDIVDDPERPAIVMELLDGPTLRKLLSDEGQLAPERAVDLLSQLGATLAAAHKAGIAHGDVKPENVIVTRDEQGLESPIITDFGLARVLEQAGTTHSRSQVIGTPHYAGPEVHSGEKPQAATDVYALGVLGYEMVTGSRPFVAPTTSGLISQHLHDAPPTDPRIPPNLWAIFEACLAKDPAARPQTSRLTTGLTDLMSGDQLSADATPTTRWSPAPAATAEEPKPNRRPVYAALAVVALVVAGGGGYVTVARTGASDIALVPPAEAPTTDVVGPAVSTSDATSSAPPAGATEDGNTSAGPPSAPVGVPVPEPQPVPAQPAPQAPAPDRPREQPAPQKPPAAQPTTRNPPPAAKPPAAKPPAPTETFPQYILGPNKCTSGSSSFEVQWDIQRNRETHVWRRARVRINAPQSMGKQVVRLHMWENGQDRIMLPFTIPVNEWYGVNLGNVVTQRRNTETRAIVWLKGNSSRDRYCDASTKW